MQVQFLWTKILYQNNFRNIGGRQTLVKVLKWKDKGIWQSRIFTGKCVELFLWALHFLMCFASVYLFHSYFFYYLGVRIFLEMLDITFSTFPVQYCRTFFFHGVLGVYCRFSWTSSSVPKLKITNSTEVLASSYITSRVWDHQDPGLSGI